MIKDIKNVFKKDPAARSIFEVLFCYPGLHALWAHRLSNWLWRHHLKFFGRLNSHIARFFTQIEIHPGATIGERFFIDHGSGVVIGETTIIGDDVLLYQGVVLGGTSLNKGKRHPTLENGVVVGAGAIVLGDIAIGENARVGAGSVVLKEVPAESTVVGVPGRVTQQKESSCTQLDHNKLPDPVLTLIGSYETTIAMLEERLCVMEDRLNNRNKSAEEEAVDMLEAAITGYDNKQTLKKMLSFVEKAEIDVVDKDKLEELLKEFDKEQNED